jgi:hypothetical protein
MRSGSEQRRHSRFDGSQLTSLLTFGGAAHPEASVDNVSLGGAMMTVAEAPAPGKCVQLALWRMGRHAVKLVGHVMAVVPPAPGHELPGLRIRFLPPTAAVSAQLHAMICDLPSELGDRDIIAPADPDESTIRAQLEEELIAAQLRIEALERQLRRMRRGALTLGELLIPAALAS